MAKMNLYIDVDGVLIGKDAPDSPTQRLARHAEEFLTFALNHFDVSWLTTHCRGDAQRVVEYLRMYAPDNLMPLLRQIRPTNWDTLKTEALQGDFYWLDDSPMQAELNWLRERDLLDRWIEVDVRRNPNDLLRAMTILRLALAKDRLG